MLKDVVVTASYDEYNDDGKISKISQKKLRRQHGLEGSDYFAVHKAA